MSSRRLFFAAWPDPALRAAINDTRASLFPMSGRPVDPDNFHITLAFLGTVAEVRLPALLALSSPLPAIEVVLDRVEHWRKSAAVVATCTVVPSRLGSAVDQLWSRLDRLGFTRDPRPFKPHVTLARDAKSLPNGSRWRAVRWNINHVRLVESVVSNKVKRYQIIA